VNEYTIFPVIVVYYHTGCKQFHTRMRDVRECAGGWVHFTDIQRVEYKAIEENAECGKVRAP
jgi:hypothetical protein